MKLFISAGEPSGDLHAANLIHSIQTSRPSWNYVGFGGPHMESAGCRLLYPLSQHPVMGIGGVLANITTFLSLVSQADRYFRHQRPDAVVLIDYPGFHWWLARRAHFHRIPVLYFVPPQIWAWASWRVANMRRWVDHVLCTLPFEKKWYEERGVNANYVGHPYFDELAQQRFDQGFLDRQRSQPGKVVALLPGSRTMEVDRNLSTLVRAARHVHVNYPKTRFLMAAYKESHAQWIKERTAGLTLPLEVHVGKTPEIINLAHSCVAVSGSVGLELLYQGKPTVVIYRIRRYEQQLGKILLKSKYISLVNLLADRELFPEHPTVHNPGEMVGKQILGWLRDRLSYQRLRNQLKELSASVAKPGACNRAADFVVNHFDPQAQKIAA